MAIRAQLPNGDTLEFPDGTPDAVIDRVVRQHVGVAPADNSPARGFVLGAIKPIDNLTRLALQTPVGRAVDRFGVSIGLPSSQDTIPAKDAARAANTRKGFQLLGNIAGTAPTLALPGGALAQGAAQGALLTDAEDVRGVARDVVSGAAFGKLGDLAARGAANAIGPRVNRAIATLRDAGITAATPGQIARATGTRVGQAIGKAEDKVMSLPFVGAIINADRDRAVDQLNRAFVNRVLKPLGQKLPDDVPTGFDAVRYAQDAVRDAYQRAIPSAAGRADRKFLERVAVIRARTSLPPEAAAKFDEIARREIGALFDAKGAYTGKRLGQVLDRLDKLAAAYRRSLDDPYKREMGEAIAAMREQIFDLVGRQNPAVRAQLKAANEAYANLVRLEKATVNATDGIATPAQFRRAVIAADRSARRRRAAAGEALGQDLANTAAKALSSQVPDSGTFTRASQANILALGLGAGAVPLYALAKGGTRAALGTPGPQAMRAADLLRRNARVAGAVTAPAALAVPRE